MLFSQVFTKLFILITLFLLSFFLLVKNKIKLKRALEGCFNPLTKHFAHIDALGWHHSSTKQKIVTKPNPREITLEIRQHGVISVCMPPKLVDVHVSLP